VPFMSLNFEPLVRDRVRKYGKFITLDKQSRIMLSAEFRREFASIQYEKEIPFDILVFLEKSRKIIGIVNAEKERMVAGDKLRCDKRGYANGRDIAQAFRLDPRQGPYRFEYVGPSDHEGYRLDTFRLVEAE
jgi:hypothetical protein